MHHIRLPFNIFGKLLKHCRKCLLFADDSNRKNTNFFFTVYLHYSLQPEITIISVLNENEDKHTLKKKTTGSKLHSNGSFLMVALWQVDRFRKFLRASDTRAVWCVQFSGAEGFWAYFWGAFSELLSVVLLSLVVIFWFLILLFFEHYFVFISSSEKDNSSRILATNKIEFTSILSKRCISHKLCISF